MKDEIKIVDHKLDFTNYNPKGKKVLLYSNGSDSWLIKHLWKPDILLYVDMGSRYSQNEIEKLKADPENENVVIDKLDLGKWERPDAIIPLRNLYLVMWASNYGDEICLGATAGDRVLDKSPTFAEKTSDLLSYLYTPQHWVPEGRNIKVNIDFKKYTKAQMIKMFVDQGGDIQAAFDKSFSCYDPINGKECWHCKPCFRKYVAFKLAGYKFNKEIEDTAINYIKKDIYPQIEANTYGRRDEELEIIKALEMYDNENNIEHNYDEIKKRYE